MEQLIELLKSISPQVWATLLKQVYIETLTNLLIWLPVTGVGAWALWFRVAPKLDEDGHDDFVLGAVRVAALVMAGVALSILVGGFLRLINPEFYAIRFLLWQLPD